jgi:hypothetical protein
MYFGERVKMTKVTWTNRQGGDWATPSNWRGGIPPLPGDTALISKASNPVTSGGLVVITGLNVGAGEVLDITGGVFHSTTVGNNGTIEATGGSMNFGATLPTAAALLNNNGLISAAGGAVTFHDATVRQAAGARINATGVGSTVTLKSTQILGGGLSTSAGGLIKTGDSRSVLDGSTTLGAVTNAGSLQLNNATSLTLKGSIVNSGSISVDGTANATSLIVGAALVTLSGGGQVTLAAHGQIYGASATDNLVNLNNTIVGGGVIESLKLTNDGTIDDNAGRMVINTSTTVANAGVLESMGTGVLVVVGAGVTNAAGGQVIDDNRLVLDGSTLSGGSLTIGTGAFLYNGTTGGTVNIGSGTVSNAGLILGVAGGLTIEGAVNNSGGRVEALNGDLTITGALGGTGRAQLTGSGVLELDGTVSENVFFTAGTSGSTGTVVLGDSAGFSGYLVGLSKSGTNHVELSNIAWTLGDYATFHGSTNSGTLTVYNSANTALASIKLAGADYTTSSFTLTQDTTSGGIVITDPPKASVLASAMAGFGATGATPVGHAAMTAQAPHLLAFASHA